MQSLTIERQVHFTLGRRARRVIQDGPPPVTPPPKGRVPRISRLMALAIRFDRLIKEGEITWPAPAPKIRPIGGPHHDLAV